MMRRERINIVMVAALFFTASLLAGAPEGYKLVFSDEFEGDELDKKKWHTNYAPKVHPPGTNEEKQIYRAENVSVRDGKLHLKATKEGGKYFSGMISSHDLFSRRYGWFEARVKLPAGKGLWPAFWLLPTNKRWPPEIDIFETRGSKPNEVVFTWHQEQAGTWKPKSVGKTWKTQDFTKDFHTVALQWDPFGMKWFVDGVERHWFPKYSPRDPMYLILNLAVGGTFDGDPDASTPFPSEMIIDYVRVFDRNRDPRHPTPVKLPGDRFELGHWYRKVYPGMAMLMVTRKSSGEAWDHITFEIDDRGDGLGITLVDRIIDGKPMATLQERTVKVFYTVDGKKQAHPVRNRGGYLFSRQPLPKADAWDFTVEMKGHSGYKDETFQFTFKKEWLKNEKKKVKKTISLHELEVGARAGNPGNQEVDHAELDRENAELARDLGIKTADEEKVDE